MTAIDIETEAWVNGEPLSYRCGRCGSEKAIEQTDAAAFEGDDGNVYIDIMILECAECGRKTVWEPIGWDESGPWG